MRIYRFGISNIPLTYTFQELSKKVEKIVDEMPQQFTFASLCQRVIQIADNEGKLKKEQNTEYSSVQLTTKDVQSISRIIWDMIWKNKIYIVFNAYPYHSESKEFVFAKI